MKKTLIALAAVAVAGAASAQVTLSGSVAYGYQATTSSTKAVTGVAGTAAKGYTDYVAAVAEAKNVKASGFGVDTAAITMAASEDLGGGLKVSGSMTLGGITRGDTPTGEDFKMVVSGGFGTVLLGQIEIGSGIRGLGQAGAPVNNMEGEVLAAATSGTDIIGYTAPKMGDFTFGISHTENKGLATGLSNGQVSALTPSVSYASGPLAAKLDYTDWDSDSTTVDSRYRISAKYDLGVAAVGAGYENIKGVTKAADTKLSIVGVNVPMGTMSFGMVYVTNKTGTAETRKGTSIGMQYNLSKRTNVTANYASWDSVVANTTDKKTTILLNHSF